MRPNLSSTREALDFILKAIEKAGYKPGEDIYLALDCAATEYYKDGKYEMKGEGKSLTSDENVALPRQAWSHDYPIISIEDGMRRGRLGRLEGADRRARRQDASWSATTCSSPTPSASPTASSRGVRQLASWSRSTRSAR